MKNTSLRFCKKIHKHLYSYLVNNYMGVLDENNNVNHIITALDERFDEYYKELIAGNTVCLQLKLISAKGDNIDKNNVRIAGLSVNLSEDDNVLTISSVSSPLFKVGDVSSICKIENVNLKTNITKDKHKLLVGLDVINFKKIKPIIKELFSTMNENSELGDVETNVEDSEYMNTPDIQNCDNSTDNTIDNFVNILNKYRHKLTITEIPEREKCLSDEEYIYSATNRVVQSVYNKFNYLERKLDSLYRKYKWLVTITNEANDASHLKVLCKLGYHICFLNTWTKMNYQKDVPKPFRNIVEYICESYLSSETALEECELAFDNYLSEVVNIPIDHNLDSFKSVCLDIISSNSADIEHFDSQIYNYLIDKLVLHKSALYDCFNVYKAIMPIYREFINLSSSDSYPDLLKTIENYSTLNSDDKLFANINKLNNKYGNM